MTLFGPISADVRKLDAEICAAAVRDVSAVLYMATLYKPHVAFGDSLKRSPGKPAVWIDGTVPSVPKNIYGATKTAAEDLCQLF